MNMNWGSPAFVLAIIAMSFAAWIVSSWIRARHGYPIENEWGGVTHRSDPDRERTVEKLTEENDRLRGQVGRLEERLAVLERIATDPAERTAREIEHLR
jgi:hypothetical protein